MDRIVLASASPRRKEILEQIGLDFEVITGDTEEDIEELAPEETVKRLSYQKANAVTKMVQKQKVMEGDISGVFVIGADTVVSHRGKIMGKPIDKNDAIQMLSFLQGDEHKVFTGVTVIYSDQQVREQITFIECTKVRVVPMTKEQIEDYVETGEPMDKSGSYAIQGRFAAYIKDIHGDYYNVVGLPVCRLLQIIRNLQGL